MILNGGINEGLTRSWPASQQCCYAHWVSCEAPRLGTLRIRIVHVRPAPVSHIKSSSHTERANNSGLKMVITRRNITCYSAVTQSLNHTETVFIPFALVSSHHSGAAGEGSVLSIVWCVGTGWNSRANNVWCKAQATIRNSPGASRQFGSGLSSGKHFGNFCFSTSRTGHL